ncbi:phosphatidylglycerol:prolipoprotein diacylglycerol transferase [Sinobacterium caligoides]|uniref:Phosphatidylglycerol--prolipoprotein diacylglyceryl transferase n=1 Tax=Sinobacterium caligoides TaxID=933926 RepID=A0A3N2DGC2_9GAMM|nr:prolipoprotein diacylglyceryl transferase [Sinobacterium caligoides]ROR98846.1 phosphatidylglycerol:prolipoprotein diacylglycerol transferase [Sinobacterium caligoides]
MLQYPQIDPVAVAIGPLEIHWYGLMYLFGLAGGWWLATRRAVSGRYVLSEREQVDDLIFYCAMGIVLGGRLGYVFFYGFDRFLQDPLWLFRVWEGGMAFHGGLIGVIVAMWLFARKVNVKPFELLDFIAPIVPIGLGLGRIGNFIGQELWGRPTDVSWAMIFPNDPEQLARHPSQLYQAGLEGLAMFVILYWFSSKPRPKLAVSGLFMLLYGCFRFFVEFFRQPDVQIGLEAFGWMSRGQELSLPMVFIGLGLLVYAYRNNRDQLSPKPL